MRRVGIDIGGTFTDAVFVDDGSGQVRTVKTSTTDDLVSGVRKGFREVCDRVGTAPADVDRFAHGSTVAVNALIEETGARTALITTSGFRDILEIGEGFRDASLLYTPCGPHQPPLVPRRYRFEVEERVGVDGAVRTPLDIDDLDGIIDELLEKDIEAVAVCFLHAYRNPANERRAEERIRERAPDIEVSVSADVSPVIREYPRTATTAVDAYLKPVVDSYLDRLEEELRAERFDDVFTVMKSDGGIASSALVADRPVTQVVSGPVAGVESARFIGRMTGFENLLTLDMGGTSVDTAMIEGGSPVEAETRSVRGMKINGPFVDVETRGAGGGAIAWLDEVDALQVGPRSAGANPGPICYGRGGEEPTVTDADLLLGILNPEGFAGGAFDLDEDAARDGLRRHVAKPLGVSVREAAVSIREIVDAHLANAVRASSIEQGKDPREFALMAFGGAGPMHACAVAEELGIGTVVVPNNAGLVSSMGVLFADVTHDYSQSLIETVGDVDVDRIESIAMELADRATADLDAESIDPTDRRFALSFDMRYTGQSHNLNLPIEADSASVDRIRESITRDGIDDLADAFAEEHRDQYGFVDETNTIDLINVRLTATGLVEDPDLGVEPPGTTLEDARRGEREVVLERDSTVTAPYYDWSDVPTGCDIGGPAVIEMDNSTVWLSPAFDAEIDGHKHLIATQEVAR